MIENQKDNDMETEIPLWPIARGVSIDYGVPVERYLGLTYFGI